MFAKLVFKATATILQMANMYEDILSGAFALDNGEEYLDLLDLDISYVINDNPMSMEVVKTNRASVGGLAGMRILKSEVGSSGIYKYINVTYETATVSVNYIKDYDESTETATPWSHWSWIGFRPEEGTSIKKNEVLWISASNDHFATFKENGSGIQIISEYEPKSLWDKIEKGRLPVCTSRSNAYRSLDRESYLGVHFTSANYYDWLVPTFPDSSVPGKIQETYLADSNMATVVLDSDTYTKGLQLIIGSSYTEGRILSSDLQYTTPLMPLVMRNSSKGHLGGDISAKCGIYLLPMLAGYIGDIITSNGTDYMVWPAYGDARVAVPMA